MKTDGWIVKQVKKKNEKAIYEIIDKYGGLLFSVIKSHSVGYIDFHEECFNDVLLAIWENIDQYDPDRSSFKNWIGAIARYKALNIIRENKKHMNYSEIEGKEIIDIRAITRRP